MYQWDQIVNTHVARWVQAAESFGLSRDDLRQIAMIAAWKAQTSWKSDRGRTLTSWVYLRVEMAVHSAVRLAGKHAADDYERDPYDDDQPDDDLELRYHILECLAFFEARLPDEDWTLLWLNFVCGYKCSELASRWGLDPAAMRQRLQRIKRKSVTLWRQRTIVRTGADNG